jgi:hypothetical protein
MVEEQIIEGEGEEIEQEMRSGGAVRARAGPVEAERGPVRRRAGKGQTPVHLCPVPG